jgi:hypothetical protein
MNNTGKKPVTEGVKGYLTLSIFKCNFPIRKRQRKHIECFRPSKPKGKMKKILLALYVVPFWIGALITMHHLAIKYDHAKWDFGDWLGITTFSFVVALLAWTFLLAFFVTEMPPNSALVKDGKMVMKFEKRAEFWSGQFRKLFGNARILTAGPVVIDLKMHLKPITDNPKVRDLWYILKVKWCRTPEDMLALEKLLEQRKESGISSIDTLLEYICYELHEAKSKEMAKFFNPRDSKQQKEFAGLVTEFFKGNIGESIPFSFEKICFGLA